MKKLSEMNGKGIEIKCECGIKHIFLDKILQETDIKDWAKEWIKELNVYTSCNFGFGHTYQPKNSKIINWIKKNILEEEE